MNFARKLTEGIRLFCAIAALSLTASCLYDKFPPCDPEDPDGSEAFLSMKISLQVMDKTRATADFEKYEDEIDTRTLRLLFFDAATDVCFKTFTYNDLVFIPIEDSKEHSVKNLYVRIPVTDDDFVKTIREKAFKIAVLANWPADTPALKEGAAVNRLHHLTSADKDPMGKDGKDKIYGFLSGDGGYLGMYTDWVGSKMAATGKDALTEENAADWIRANWDPALLKNELGGPYQYDTYSDLWFLWNFGGADRVDAGSDANATGSDANSSNAIKYKKWAGEWEKRNGERLRKWITDAIAENDGKMTDLVDNTDGTYKDRNYLRFKTIEGAMAVVRPESGKTYYGVRLPKVAPSGSNSVMKEEDPGVFSFMARATGNLSITARHAGSNYEKDAKIVVQRGNSASTTDFNFSGSGVTTITKKISITGDEERLFIYNGSTNSQTSPNLVDIFQIEYIQDKYLYDTDRKGVTPAEQRIPMYGIQQYGALGNVWIKGTVFDLSDFNGTGPSDYAYHDITLLRSVAKVELMIPSSLGPHHVFLRSQNRTARCEPVDVSTSTGTIWTDVSGAGHPAACEWFQIKGHQPFFDIDEAKKDVSFYQSDLAWYFGTWKDPENGKIGKVTVPDKRYGGTQTDYPHILNPMINRSDFTEFLPAGTVDGMYNRYVLYVPEKFVDDPDTAGDKTSSPKVCHIEFRSADDPFTNLDDNNCYRIYFVEGGVAAGAKIPDFTKPDGSEYYNTWEKVYEEDIENLKNHWPIMRNHLYSFTVKDLNSRIAVVNLEVLPWKVVDDNSYNW